MQDTALEVQKARNLGISVLGIFIGDEEDLAIERKIFGKEFVYTQKIESFAHIVEHISESKWNRTDQFRCTRGANNE